MKVYNLILTFLLILIIGACQKSPEIKITEDTFIFPGEFEEHESIWLAWPVYEYMSGRPAEKVILNIINALEPYIIIDLMVQDSMEMAKVQDQIELLGISTNHIRFHSIPHGDVWIRDMGPIFLKNQKGEMKIADFGFNTWGYEKPTDEYSMLEEQVDRLVARELDLPIIRSSIISEGGNREFNGKGTMMITEAVVSQRNPDWKRDDLEEELKRIFNLKKIIWLPKGVADDELTFRGTLPGNVFTVITTGGHIDEYARFADPNTILLAEVTPEERDADSIAAMSYQNLEEAYHILKNETDQDGKPFKIIRVPYTEAIYEMMDSDDEVFLFLKDLEYEDGTVIEEGSTIKTIIAASYLNYIITNGVVLIPSYWVEGRSQIIKEKDERFKQIMQEVYPDRDIIQINPENVNIGGGGMHCISQQMPAIVNYLF
jgi:agmatine deiminase